MAPHPIQTLSSQSFRTIQLAYLQRDSATFSEIQIERIRREFGPEKERKQRRISADLKERSGHGHK